MPSATAFIPVGSIQQWCLAGFDAAPRDPLWDLCHNTTPWTRGRLHDHLLRRRDHQHERRHLGLIDRRQARDGFDGQSVLPTGRQEPRGPAPSPGRLHALRERRPDVAGEHGGNKYRQRPDPRRHIHFVSAGTADWRTRSTPSCLWADTKSADGTTEVTLPAAKISTLPPESGEVYSRSASPSTSLRRRLEAPRLRPCEVKPTRMLHHLLPYLCQVTDLSLPRV